MPSLLAWLDHSADDQRHGVNVDLVGDSLIELRRRATIDSL
jgi:hypothetical protein